MPWAMEAIGLSARQCLYIIPSKFRLNSDDD